METKNNEITDHCDEVTHIARYCNYVAYFVQKRLGDKYIVREGKAGTRIGIGIEEKDAGESSEVIFIYMEEAYEKRMPAKAAAHYSVMAYHSEKQK